MRKFVAPDGGNIFKIEDDIFMKERFQVIAFLSSILISQHSRIEFMLYKLFISRLGASAEDVANIFEDLKNNNSRIERINKELKSKTNPKQYEIYLLIMNNFKEIVEVRNKLCHCMWASENSVPDDLVLMEHKNLYKVSAMTIRASAKDDLKHQDAVDAINNINSSAFLLNEIELRRLLDKSNNIFHAIVNLDIYISDISQKNCCENNFKLNKLTKEILF